jgi:hypothetical protein
MRVVKQRNHLGNLGYAINKRISEAHESENPYRELRHATKGT